MINAYLPQPAEILERIQESATIFTLRLRFCDPALQSAYRFHPGQFNMLYLHGVGEVPISIVSDPDDEQIFEHAIRVVGRVTRGLAQLRPGDQVGVRGPFGRGWPLHKAIGRDVVLITGGLGCAPLVSVINYVVRRRDQYRRLVIMQGVKHAADFIWQARYDHWQALPHTQVLLAASQGGPGWPYATGHVTALLEQAEFNATDALAMLCGPEAMMQAAVEQLRSRNVPETDIWLSMERNMQCAIGHCGHCQHGARFVCKDGPVFCYPEIKTLLGVRGF